MAEKYNCSHREERERDSFEHEYRAELELELSSLNLKISSFIEKDSKMYFYNSSEIL